MPWLTDRKFCHIRLEGSAFGDVPLTCELKLEVWDSPNSAGVVIDAVRCAKLALDRGLSGALYGPSSWFMKSPPTSVHRRRSPPTDGGVHSRRTMTSLYLVRHAAHVLQDQILVGRLPRIELSEAGLRQIEGLRRHFRTVPLDVIRTGPLHRARATAGELGAPVEVDDALNEIDYGEWTGHPPAQLSSDPAWRDWNVNRGAARVPGVESMQEVQDRAVEVVERLRRDRPDARVALVSHGDVLRAILVFYLGMPLDHLARLTVDPGSVTQLIVEAWGPTLVCLNQTNF